ILRLAGAREVHVRIGCLPIRFPCYLGIDMKTRDQFIANEKTVPEIAEFIEADSLGYLSLRGLISALKHSRDDICLGCLTGDSPRPNSGGSIAGTRPRSCAKAVRTPSWSTMAGLQWGGANTGPPTSSLGSMRAEGITKSVVPREGRDCGGSPASSSIGSTAAKGLRRSPWRRPSVRSRNEGAESS